MSTGTGIPVTRLLVSGCKAKYEPLQLTHFLSNQSDVWYVAFFCIFVQNTFFPLNRTIFERFFDTDITAIYCQMAGNFL